MTLVRPSLLTPLGVSVLSLLGGVIAASAPWWMGLGALFGIAGAAAILASPYFGLMLTLALAVQALPGALLPPVPIGGAQVYAQEMTLLLTLISALLHAMHERVKAPGPDWRFVTATIIVFAALVISFLVSAYVMGQRDFAFPVLRNFLPLALLPLLPRLLPDRQRIEQTEHLIIAFAVALAMFIAVQAFTNMQLLAGRFEDLGLGQTTGVTRTVLWGPELLIILSLLLIARRGIQFALSRLWPLPVTGILLLGLIGTYTRTFWISTALCLGLLTLATQGARGLFKLLSGLLPVVVIVWIAIFAVSPRIAEATFDRAFGITQEIESGDSFGWRGKENAQALEAIAANPVLGIGFNGVYKKSISTRGHFPGEEIYIHNAYLYFLLKMGLPGALILATFLILYLRLMAASAAIRTASDRTSALAYGVLGVAIMLIGYSGQTISRFVTLLIICLMFTIMRFYATRN